MIPKLNKEGTLTKLQSVISDDRQITADRKLAAETILKIQELPEHGADAWAFAVKDTPWDSFAAAFARKEEWAIAPISEQERLSWEAGMRKEPYITAIRETSLEDSVLLSRYMKRWLERL